VGWVPNLECGSAKEPPMRYDFFLFQDGAVVGKTDCECANDSEARETACAFPGSHTVEIYLKNGLVARVRPGGETMDDTRTAGSAT